MSSALSLDEIKDLILFARAQKVITLEHNGLRFQFNIAAHEPEHQLGQPATNKPNDESRYGHFVPE